MNDAYINHIDGDPRNNEIENLEVLPGDRERIEIPAWQAQWGDYLVRPGGGLTPPIYSVRRDRREKRVTLGIAPASSADQSTEAQFSWAWPITVERSAAQPLAIGVTLSLQEAEMIGDPEMPIPDRILDQLRKQARAAVAE